MKSMGMYDIKSQYINGKAELLMGEYGDGSPAIVMQSEHGERLAVATVCIDVQAKPSHVWLKGWSENEGIPEALEAAGVLSLTGQTYPTGYVHAQEAKLEATA